MGPIVVHPYLVTPARTTVASLKQYIAGLPPVYESQLDTHSNRNVSVSVATGSGGKESLPDDFALGSLASRSAETGNEGFPVVYFQIEPINTS
jgi:hypothetical protein